MGQDAAHFHDTLKPFVTADLAQVTLSTSDKALYPAGAFPAPGTGWFNVYPGQRIHIRLFGKMTTGTTPGNGTVDVYWGSGADASGTIIASSATVALTASQTNLSWTIEVWVHSRANGPTTTSGSLFCTGNMMANNAVLATSLQPLLIPASAAAAVASLDFTGTNIVSVQFKRSGSTAETMTVQDMQVDSLNAV